MSTHIGQVNIGGKDYPIKLNLAFTRYLDNAYTTEQGGGIGMGMNRLIVLLRIHSMEAAIDFIKAGTASEPQKPSNEDLEAFINNADDLEWLFEMASEGLKKSPVTRLQAADILEALDEKIAKKKV